MGPETLSALLAALYRRLWLIVLVVAGALGGGWYFAGRLPPLYLARASTFVPVEAPRMSLNSELPNLPSGPLLPDASEATRVGLVGIMSSNAVYERTAQRVPGLDVERLRRNVVVDVDVHQHLVVLMTDPDRERAVLLANEFLYAFQDVMRELAERGPRATLATLEAEEPLAWQANQAARDGLVAYLDSIDSPDPEVDLQLLVAERQRILDQLADLRVEESRNAAQRPVVAEQLQDRPEFIETRRTLVANPRYQGALQELAALRVELAVQLLRYTAAHPVLERLRERMAAAEEQARREAQDSLVFGSSEFDLDARTRSLMDRLVEFELSDAGRTAVRQVLEERLQVAEEGLARIPVNRAELARLDHEIGRTEEHARRVSQRVAELRLQLARGLDYTVVDESRLAQLADVRPVPALSGVLVFAAGSGLIAGLALALLAELVAQARRRRPF